MALLTGCLALAGFSGKEPVYVNFKLEPLAPGVWAALNTKHGICNAGIIDLGDKTVVFDPFMNIDAAEELKAAAEYLTHRSAALVINSHYHNDHIRGNQVFLPATIVSTYWTRQQMAISEPEELKWEKENAPGILASYRQRASTATGWEKEELPVWINYFEGMVQSGPKINTTLPNLTFTDSLWISGSRLRIKLVEFRNAHTSSDAVLLLPDLGICFTGDLLFNQNHPFLGDGHADSLKQYLTNWLASPSFQQLVPGHGPLSDLSTVKEEIRYINTLQEIVKMQQREGKPDSIIVNSPIPTPYQRWHLSRFFASNLSYLCRQASGH